VVTNLMLWLLVSFAIGVVMTTVFLVVIL